MNNEFGSEIFSDFIEHIDSSKHETVIDMKPGRSEANIFSLYYEVKTIQTLPGKVLIFYSNGFFAEIVRK